MQINVRDESHSLRAREDEKKKKNNQADLINYQTPL